MLYLFWLTHVICGALVDCKTWGKKEDDPQWLTQYYDLFWLCWYAIVPFVAVIVGTDLFSIKSALIAFGISIVWDLIYSKLEHGKWIVALPYWFIVPPIFGKRKVIGFTETGMYYFNGVRVLVLISTFFI